MLRAFKITAHYGKAAILSVSAVSDCAADVASTAAYLFPNASLIVTEPVLDMPDSCEAFVPQLTAYAA